MACSAQLTRRRFLGHTMTLGTAAMAMPHLLAQSVQAAPAGDYQLGCYTRPWEKSDLPQLQSEAEKTRKFLEMLVCG